MPSDRKEYFRRYDAERRDPVKQNARHRRYYQAKIAANPRPPRPPKLSNAEKYRRYKDRHPGRIAELQRLRYWANPERRREVSRKSEATAVAQLADRIVRRRLVEKTGLKPTEIPAQLIEWKREKLKQKRQRKKEKPDKNTFHFFRTLAGAAAINTTLKA